MDTIFKHIDNNKTGKIRLNDLLEALNKLRSPEVQSLHELRVPEASDVETVYKRMSNAGSIDTSGYVTQSEYLTVMFKTT